MFFMLQFSNKAYIKENNALTMQKDGNEQKNVVDEIMDSAIELPVENQEILLMMAKAMQYTRDCETGQATR